MARKILFEIEVENVGAARRIDALREEIKQLNKEIKGVNDGSDEYKRLTGEIAKAQIGIKDLKEQQKQLNKEFQAAKVPTDSLAGLRLEYGRLMEQIRLLTEAERNAKFGQSLIKSAAQVKGQIDGIEQSVGRFTGNVGNYRSAFGSFAEILSGGLIGGGLVVAVGAITQKFTEGITAAADYGAALDRLSAITGVVGSDLKEFEDRAQALTTIDIGAGKIVNTAQDILEAFTLVGSARPELLADAAALEEVSKQAIILSKASGDDLDTSVRAITASLAQFGLEGKDSAAIINTLAAGSKAGKVEIPGLAESLTRLGPSAKNTNVSLEESVALFELLADKGLEGERAGVQLRNLFVKLASADVLPKNAQKEFERLGISTKILSDTTLPLSERLTEFSKVAGNVSAVSRILGVENVDVGLILAANVKQFESLTATVTGTNEAFIQAGINADNVKTRIANLQAQGVNLLTEAFVAAEPAIDGAIGFLTDFVQLLADAPELINENADGLLALGVAAIAFSGSAQAAATGAIALGSAQGRQAAATIISTAVTQANTAATRALAAAQAALPLLAVIAGIYAVVKAYDAYLESASASEKAARAVAEAQKDIADETANEVSALRTNIAILKNDAVSKETRKKAIEDLTRAYPDYLKGIDLEKASVGQLTALQNQLTESIIKSSAERLKATATADIEKKIIEERLRRDRLVTEGFTTQEKAVNALVNAGRTAKKVFTGGLLSIGDVQTVTVDEVVSASENREKELLKQREETIKQFDRTFRIGTEELILALPERAAKGVADAGKEIEKTGDKITGLGGKSKAAKTEIEAQAGSIAALKKEIGDLEKEIENAPQDTKTLTPLLKQLAESKEQLLGLERNLQRLREGKSIEGIARFAPEDVTERPDVPDIEANIALIKSDELQQRVDELFEGVRGEIPATIVPPGDAPAQEGEGLDVEAARNAVKELSAINNELIEARQTAELDKRAALTESNALLVDNEQFTADQILAINNALTDGIIGKSEERLEAEKKLAEERKKLQELSIEAGINTAQTIASATLEIEKNKLQQEQDAAISALDEETKQRIEAAGGNQTKIAAIEKDAAKKKEVLEKGFAQERKKIAVKEALINTALAITRALTGAPPPGNFILAAVAAAAGAAQIAVINSQEFAEGGVAKRLKPGIVTEKPNAPRTAKGDSILAYLAPGEMMLNRGQQDTIRAMFGQDAFALAGVPGESATRRPGLPTFADGGVVGIVPQNDFGRGIAQQNVQVEAKAEFTAAQIEEIATIQGAIIAEMVSKSVFTATALAGEEKNRMLEREQIGAQNRVG